MARAKRTDRAEARRRHRLAQGEAFVDEGPEPAEEAPAAGRRPGSPPERPGIMASVRNAYHRPNYREDIVALPRLLRTKAFVIPLLIVISGIALMAIAPRGNFSLLYFTYVVFDPRVGTPGFLPLMVAGFLAIRASYLLGLVIALLDLVAGFWFVYQIAPFLLENAADAEILQAATVSALPITAATGIFFAAAAAWYRRFLTLSNAGARQRAEARRRQQAQQQRRARANRPARS